jgi:hypothetical protein
MMEIWQLTDKGVEEVYRMAYPENQQKIEIDRSKSQIRIFTFDHNVMEQDDLTLYEGHTTGSPLSKEKHEKIFAFLKRLMVKGFY